MPNAPLFNEIFYAPNLLPSFFAGQELGIGADSRLFDKHLNKFPLKSSFGKSISDRFQTEITSLTWILMPTNFANTAEVQDAMGATPRAAGHAGSTDMDGRQADARSSASKSGAIGRGIFGPIRSGLLGIVEILSRYRLLMAEIDTLDQETRAGDERNDPASPRS